MSPTPASLIALNRFGLGARPGDAALVGADAKAWLRGQIAPPPALPVYDGLPPGGISVAKLVSQGQSAAEIAKEAERLAREQGRELYAREMAARLAAQLESPAPFIERMTAFWSNHFTVSIQRPTLLGVVGAFEREAIRPNVVGRFADLLRAAESHPAMLLYLDNAQSIGPNSPVGRRINRGLNENLAREILELHSLGVDGGYSQADVRALAGVLTGWSIGRADEPNPGQFMFRARAQEPGPQTLLGVVYDGDGKQRADRALGDLARHPRTIQRLSAKLAAHVTRDDPPAALVARLTAVWTGSDGDLAAVYAALIDAPECWDPAPRKLKTPHEFALSTWRLLQDRSPPKDRLASLGALGQPSFAAPSPAGWSDREADWLGPEALMRRIESTGAKSLVIGISGGLDSTHALIVAAKACDRLGLPRS
ncbi:MAG: DUF1800 family protein, partial [Elsteraceae bacterium]